MMPEKLKVKRLEGEVAISNQYNLHLKNEMERLQKEMLDSNNAHGEKILKLENELSQVKSEILEKEYLVKNLNASKDSLAKQVNELNSKLSSLTEVNIYSEREIASMQRMIEMLKQAEEKQLKEKNEALQLVEQIKKAMDVFKEECIKDQDQLMSDKIELQSNLTKAMKELDELKREKEQQVTVGSFFPSAVNLEEKLKKDGMTLTSLYQSLVKEREEAKKFKHEKEMFELHFKSLVQEVRLK